MRYSSGHWNINKNFNETLKRNHFPDYLRYTCVNVAYSAFINKFMRAIDSVVTIKTVVVEANSKPWFYTEIISAIHKRDKLHSMYKKSSLETDKDNFKTAKIYLQKMLHKKTNLFWTKNSFKTQKKKKKNPKSYGKLWGFLV